MVEFIFKNELKRTNARNDDVGELFLYCTIAPQKNRTKTFIKCWSFNMGQRERLARKIFAGGTYMSASNIFATLYSLHAGINYTLYPTFIVLILDEQKPTSETVFTYIKTCMTHSTRVVWHTLIADGRELGVSAVFCCRIQLCLSTRTRRFWGPCRNSAWCST